MSEGFWSLLGRDNDAEDEAMLREPLGNSFGIIWDNITNKIWVMLLTFADSTNRMAI
jgi:hypothetical protein